LDAFHYGVKKCIGAYVAALDGVDAIVFTGGIGRKGPESRETICDGLEFMGIKLDAEKNANYKEEGIVSADDSRVKILVVPTNEELIVARETARVISPT
jgi:acetate kinase